MKPPLGLEIDTRSKLLSPRSSRLVLAVRARNRTATRRFTPSSASPATCSRRLGISCPRPAWPDAFIQFRFRYFVYLHVDSFWNLGRPALRFRLDFSTQPLRARPLCDLRRRLDVALGRGDPRFRQVAGILGEKSGILFEIPAVGDHGRRFDRLRRRHETDGMAASFAVLGLVGLLSRASKLERVDHLGFKALVVIYLFNPAYWNDPIAGLERFFRSNLTRGKTIPISTMFLGQIYKTPVNSLPWYNTLVWTLFVTPVGFLALAIVGVVRTLRRRGRNGSALLVVCHWTLLMVLRALPHAPGHDGVRQFLPAFGCLAILAGLGAETAVKRFRIWGKLLIAAACVEGVVSVALFMPVPLSYFSPIVNGLPVASSLGMEPTFYWDALTDDALERLASAPALRARSRSFVIRSARLNFENSADDSNGFTASIKNSTGTSSKTAPVNSASWIEA